jgi:tetratricopeptide (TPR) repeat protein
MRQRLDALNALNRADSVLTATERDEAQALADYFDSHGTPNDQMLAHYLLGRCYADMREAPMALHCYQEAITRADTLSPDCDFAQLSRVYGQSSAIFYQQGLYRNAMEYDDLSAKYGWLGKDTLCALRSYAMKAAAYDQLQMKDSAILVYDNVVKQLNTNNFKREGAVISGLLAFELQEKGELERVWTLLNEYERHSGYFSSIGEIENGREIFYYWKGLYYLKTNQLDSAEYYFRKELRTGKDFNNQNCGSHGLAMLFKQKHILDSASYYSEYSYAMNDSCFVEMSTHEVEQAKAMYDYSRNRELAQQEKNKADRQTIRLLVVCVVMILLLIVLGIIVVLFYLQLQKRKAEKSRYDELLRQLNSVQAEITTLRVHEAEFHSLIDKKESDIADQDLEDAALRDAQAELDRLRDKEKQLSGLVKEKEEAITDLQTQLARYEQRQADLVQKEQTELERLSNIPFYQDLIDKSNKGTLLSDDEWNSVNALVKEVLPEFYVFLTTKKNYLNEKEYKVCLLTRLHFLGKTSAAFIGLAPSYITKYRKDLHVKLFQGDGDSKAFVQILGAIG